MAEPGDPTLDSGGGLLGRQLRPQLTSALCHAAGTQWDNKKYMNMKYLEVASGNSSIID